jgi:hypothetical protein
MTYTGLKGETCYILITDHAATTLDGAPRISKAAPLVWLNDWLLQHAPTTVPNKYVYLDQGGKLYRNPKNCSLFQRFGYQVYPTGVDSSHQNGPVE